MKKTEDGEAHLVRLYERYGKPASTMLEFALPIRKALLANGFEEAGEELAAKGRSLELTLPANGIVACRVEFEGGAAVIAPPQARIEFPRDTRVSGKAGEKGGLLLPLELLPDRVRAGGLEFLIEDQGGMQALACAGQAIDLPDTEAVINDPRSDPRRLSILACAREDLVARFGFEDASSLALQDAEARLPAMSGFLGQWDRRLWKKDPAHVARFGRDYVWNNPCTGITPGYIRRERLAWFSTHCHDGTGDLPYRFGYVHLAEIAIPDGARRIVLPRDPRLLLVAMTVSSPPAWARSANFLHDPWEL